MNNSTALITTNQNVAEDNFFDAFSDIGQVDPFELKKDHLGAQMSALMVFSGKNRTELAEILGWKKSRVSNVLSGKCNLTIKSVWDFASSLGFDFDVVFLTPQELHPVQPWQITRREVTFFPFEIGRVPVIEIQTALEVAHDILTGSYKNIYISLGTSSREIDVTPSQLGNLSQTNSDSFWSTAMQIPIPK